VIHLACGGIVKGPVEASISHREKVVQLLVASLTKIGVQDVPRGCTLSMKQIRHVPPTFIYLTFRFSVIVVIAVIVAVE
jgi:hypothetical protein